MYNEKLTTIHVASKCIIEILTGKYTIKIPQVNMQKFQLPCTESSSNKCQLCHPVATQFSYEQVITMWLERVLLHCRVETLVTNNYPCREFIESYPVKSLATLESPCEESTDSFNTSYPVGSSVHYSLLVTLYIVLVSL